MKPSLGCLKFSITRYTRCCVTSILTDRGFISYCLYFSDQNYRIIGIQYNIKFTFTCDLAINCYPASLFVQVFPPNEKIENINDQYWTLRAEEVVVSFCF